MLTFRDSCNGRRLIIGRELKIQKAEGRGQRAEGRGQRAEGRREAVESALILTRRLWRTEVLTKNLLALTPDTFLVH